MAVYVVASVKFTDEARYRCYQSRFEQVFAGCGGTLLSADDQPLRLEGSDSPDRIVLMQFDGAEQASAFLLSDEYQEISRDRLAGSVTIAHAVHALDPPLR
ncbi:DUF1330 domain-containing protein [Pseudooceanicola onchidii]|uniref:DUF1330 domain-containing protein n=1 Tax=Pseudooceanicola onchidii TaxID=2562279 RepID=UPI0010AA1D37|nr:DUF1330 domain-containing protein [Pseudooceanicola onchidii]